MDKDIIERIRKNKFKTPVEKTKKYKERGYKFCGCFIGGKTGEKIFACVDCGFTQMFLMKNIEEIHVCGRCTGIEIKTIPISKANILNEIISEELRKELNH